MNRNEIWSALIDGFAPLGFSAMEKTADELGLEPGWLTWLWAIGLFDDETFSTETYMHIRPYGSARVNETRFTSAAIQGILSVSSKNEYLPTEKGRQIASQILKAADESIVHLQPIPKAELQKIADYNKRLVEASMAAPELPSKYSITHYYKNLHPNHDAPLLRLILHYIASLDQYRGAAHMASWHDYIIEGYVWSLLTSIWRNEANTRDALHEEMGSSVFTREEISQGLHDLTTRNWIEENTGRYQTTVEGKRIREQAEELTDRYFFLPWGCLNDTEQEDLQRLAIQLRDGLKGLE